MRSPSWYAVLASQLRFFVSCLFLAPLHPPITPHLPPTPSNMDAQPSGAGSSKKSTVYVAGLAPEVNEQQLLEAFVTFGELAKAISSLAEDEAHIARRYIRDLITA